jgi:hypothetical protein
MYLTAALCKRRNPFMILSSIFRWVEGTTYSHCAWILDDMVYEANIPKGRKISVKEWSKHYELVYTYQFQITDEQKAQALEVLQGFVGKPYSFFQLFVILAELCSSAAKNFIRYLEFNGESQYICTETIAVILNKIFLIAIPEDCDHISLKETRYLLDNTMKHWNDLGYRANRLQYFLKGVK